LKIETHLCSYKPKLKDFFTFSSFHRNFNIFVTKIGFKLSEIIDTVSGENLSRIQGSESRKIPDPNHQHWYFNNLFLRILISFADPKLILYDKDWYSDPTYQIPYDMDISTTFVTSSQNY